MAEQAENTATEQVVDNPVLRVIEAKRKEREALKVDSPIVTKKKEESAKSEEPAKGAAEPAKPSIADMAKGVAGEPDKSSGEPVKSATEPKKIEEPAKTNPEPAKTDPTLSDLNEAIKKITNGGFETMEAFVTDYNNQRTKASKVKDKFVEDALDYYAKTGNLAPYLEAKTVDYDKMTPENLIRKALREEYPEYSEKVFDRVFRKEMEKYVLDEDADPEDVEEAKEKLEITAKKLREKFKANQAKFAAPEPEPDKTKENAEAQKAAFAKSLSESEPVRNLIAAKKLGYKIGEKPELTLEVKDPQAIVDAMIDEQKFFSNFAKDGKLDYDKIFRVYQHALRGEEYDKALIQLGRDQYESELKNAKLDFTDIGGRKPAEGTEKEQNRILDGLKSYYGSR